jgi:hypothetical protein
VSNEIEGKRHVTTTEVLSEEKRVVDLVRYGTGKREKIGLDQGSALRRGSRPNKGTKTSCAVCSPFCPGLEPLRCLRALARTRWPVPPMGASKA